DDEDLGDVVRLVDGIASRRLRIRRSELCRHICVSVSWTLGGVLETAAGFAVDRLSGDRDATIVGGQVGEVKLGRRLRLGRGGVRVEFYRADLGAVRQDDPARLHSGA